VAATLGCWLHDVHFSKLYMTEEVSKVMLNMHRREVVVNSQIPGANKDPIVARRDGAMGSGLHRNPYELVLPDGQIENIGWLISSK
jgi:hypothetical protein